MELEFKHTLEVQGEVEKIQTLLQDIQSENINPHTLARVEKRLCVYYAYIGVKYANYTAEREFLKRERKRAFARAHGVRRKTNNSTDSSIYANEDIEKECMDEALSIFRSKHLGTLLTAIEKNLISIAHRLKIAEAEQKRG